MFGITNYPAFVVAFILLLFIPGPGNLALISSAGKGGLRGGLASVLGLLLGDQVLLWLAAAGAAAVLVANPVLFKTLQLAGALYLIWLGFKMLFAGQGERLAVDIQAGQYFKQTMLITLLNPKAVMFYVAFFPQFIDPVRHQGVLTLAAMAVTIAALGFLYCFAVVLVTHYAGRRLRANPRAVSALNKLAGVLLVGFGARLAMN
ncbi:MAG: LysE family transporter [Cytophagales bacterium]|nr:LysE family transporter [Cytophagales bacterium]